MYTSPERMQSNPLIVTSPQVPLLQRRVNNEKKGSYVTINNSNYIRFDYIFLLVKHLNCRYMIFTYFYLAYAVTKYTARFNSISHIGCI